MWQCGLTTALGFCSVGKVNDGESMTKPRSSGTAKRIMYLVDYLPYGVAVNRRLLLGLSIFWGIAAVPGFAAEQ